MEVTKVQRREVREFSQQGQKSLQDLQAEVERLKAESEANEKSWHSFSIVALVGLILMSINWVLSKIMYDDINAWWDWYIITMRVTQFILIKAAIISISKNWMQYIADVVLGLVAADTVDKVLFTTDGYKWLSENVSWIVIPSEYDVEWSLYIWVAISVLIVSGKHRKNILRWKRNK